MCLLCGVAPLEIPLPLLKAEHVEEILKNLASRDPDNQPAMLGRELDFVVKVLGGIPRYIEILAFCLGSDKENQSSVQAFHLQEMSGRKD
jgi:hypothetical protein